MAYFSARSERGFELVEVVLAAGILSLTLLSIIGIAGRSILVSHQALDSYTASALLEEGAEAARIVRDGGWSNISSLSSGTTYYPAYDTSTDTWSFSPSPVAVGIYDRTMVLSDVDRDSSADIDSSGTLDPGTRLFTETVSWKESDGSSASKSLSFYLMDDM